MKHVSILALRDSNFASIVDARSVLLKVNELLALNHQPKAFDVQIVGMQGDTSLSDGLYSIHPEVMTDALKKTDLIIIPALEEI